MFARRAISDVSKSDLIRNDRSRPLTEEYIKEEPRARRSCRGASWGQDHRGRPRPRCGTGEGGGSPGTAMPEQSSWTDRRDWRRAILRPTGSRRRRPPQARRPGPKRSKRIFAAAHGYQDKFLNAPRDAVSERLDGALRGPSRVHPWADRRLANGRSGSARGGAGRQRSGASSWATGRARAGFPSGLCRSRARRPVAVRQRPRHAPPGPRRADLPPVRLGRARRALHLNEQLQPATS